MKFAATVLLVASLATSALAHATVQAVWINGADKGGGAIRRPPNNNPVKNVQSQDMFCNVGGSSPAGTWLPVRGGDSVTFEWAHNTRGDDIIASSHKGPALVYITPAASNSWVKLFADGSSPGNWAVDKIISTGGKHYIVLPNLPAGRYLLRPELITLHESDTSYQADPARGAQLYMECVQIEVTSSGSATLPGGVQFPGAYTFAQVTFNLYGGGSYTIPGPAKWSGAGAGGYGMGPGNSSPQPTQGQTTVRTTAGQTTTRTTTQGSTPTNSGSCAAKYGQCGGKGWSGATCCASGSTCKASGEYYSQCL